MLKRLLFILILLFCTPMAVFALLNDMTLHGWDFVSDDAVCGTNDVGSTSDDVMLTVEQGVDDMQFRVKWCIKGDLEGNTDAMLIYSNTSDTLNLWDNSTAPYYYFVGNQSATYVPESTEFRFYDSSWLTHRNQISCIQTDDHNPEIGWIFEDHYYNTQFNNTPSSSSKCLEYEFTFEYLGTGGQTYQFALLLNGSFIPESGMHGRQGIMLQILENGNIDNTPPNSSTNLQNISSGLDWIYWNWTQPVDSDFSHNQLYVNGMSYGMTSNNYFNATGLSQEGTNYTLTLHSVDLVGNINDTDVNSTAQTLMSYTPISSCQSLSSPGEYRLTTDLLGITQSSCINIASNNVTFDCQGHIIDSTDFTYNSAININRASQQTTNITIKNCILRDWYDQALHLNNANGNFIDNVTFTSNKRQPLYLTYADNNLFSNLDFLSSQDNIYTIYSRYNDYNNFTNVSLVNNQRGILVQQSTYNIFDNLSILNNLNDDGMYFATSSNYNTVKNSIFKGIVSNRYAIDLYSGGANYFYNNVFNNTLNVDVYSGTNYFDNGSIGNYWFNPSGTGFSEYCADLNSDFICDSPYVESYYGFTDNFPLAKNSGQSTNFNVNSCRVLDSPGIYYLNNDLLNILLGYCINIVSNNVTFDCQGHIIDSTDSAAYITAININRASQQTTNITIKNCILRDWYDQALHLNNANGNFIDNISFTSNKRQPLYLTYSDNNLFSNLDFLSSQDNIYTIYSRYNDYNNFTNVSLISNQAGIILHDTTNNIFDNLSILNNLNDHGMYLATSNYNTVKNSEISGTVSSKYAIHMYTGSNNYFYNNIFNNTQNPYNQGGTNYWDYTSIGNFWYTPTGTGFSDTCPDANVDGFCDNPPYSASGVTDNFPQTISIPISPYYISSTPLNESHITASSISIKYTNGTASDAANVTIDGTNYPMTHLGSGTWEYVHSSLPTKMQDISFNITYATGALQTRTFTYYPNFESEQLNAYSFISGLISLFFISFAFTNRKNKKAMTPIIATLLLLLVSMGAFFAVQSWFYNTQNDFHAKQFQNNNLIDDSTKVYGIKNETYYTLYLIASFPGYKEVKSIKINDVICSLEGSNVLRGNIVSKIELDCPAIAQINNLELQTKQELIQRTIRIIN